MKKSILIIGAGPGVSTGIAEKFGQEGFKVGLISRNVEKLQGQINDLQAKGIEGVFATADAYDADALEAAIKNITAQLGRVDVLIYNAAALKMKALMTETTAELVEDFKITVANAFHAAKVLYPELKQNKGTILLTGGGFALQPSPQFGSLSLGKAGLRSLAYQLHESLKADDIHVATVTINGYIQPSSETHSPKILAEKYWSLYHDKNQIEIQY